MHQEYLAHMILLSNLKENTEYEYYVGDGTNNSKTYAFKTLPTKEVEIVFLGDPQNTNETGYQITKKTLDAAFKRVPNANLLMYLILDKRESMVSTSWFKGWLNDVDVNYDLCQWVSDNP